MQKFVDWSEMLTCVEKVCRTDALQSRKCEEFRQKVKRFIKISDAAHSLISREDGTYVLAFRFKSSCGATGSLVFIGKKLE